MNKLIIKLRIETLYIDSILLKELIEKVIFFLKKIGRKGGEMASDN